MIKRILSLFLAFLMLVSMLPVSAIAEGDVQPTETTTETTTTPVETTTETTSAPVETTTETTSAPVETTTETTSAPVETTTETTSAPVETTTETTSAPAETTTETTAAPSVIDTPEEPTQAPDTGCQCPLTDGVHYATCPSYICPDCGAGPWHEACPVEEEPQQHPDLGKVVKLKQNTNIMWKNPASGDAAGQNFVTFEAGALLEIFDVYAFDAATTLYGLKLVKGAWQEGLEEYCYIDSVKVEFVEKCPDCGEYDCQVDHSAPTVPSVSDTVIDANGNEQTVTVSGDALPAGVTLSVRDTDVSAELSQFGVPADTKVFGLDISLLSEGVTYQPEGGAVVKIEVNAAPGTMIGILHKHDDEPATFLCLTEVLEDHTVEFETDSFSEFAGFTVDFHYNEIDYPIGGLTSIKLSELFPILGIDRNPAHVIDVNYSDPSQIKVSQIDGDWLLESLKAFDTEETLEITFADGEIIIIDVTDASGNNIYDNGDTVELFVDVDDQYGIYASLSDVWGLKSGNWYLQIDGIQKSSSTTSNMTYGGNHFGIRSEYYWFEMSTKSNTQYKDSEVESFKFKTSPGTIDVTYNAHSNIVYSNTSYCRVRQQSQAVYTGHTDIRCVKIYADGNLVQEVWPVMPSRDKDRGYSNSDIYVDALYGPYYYSTVSVENNTYIVRLYSHYNVSASVADSKGTASPAAQYVDYQKSGSITFTASAGYLIDYIMDGSTKVDVTDADSYTYTVSNVTGARNVVAYTRLKTYAISYNANGGSGTIGNQTKTHGTAITLSNGSALSREGYTLSGWNTKADGTGTAYALSGSYTSNATATFYAVWTPNIYKVTLDKNGGTGGTSEYWYKYQTAVKHGQSGTDDGGLAYYYTDANCTNYMINGTGTDRYYHVNIPTRTGYTFEGYYLGDVQYVDANGMCINNIYDNVPNDSTLVAKWTANTDASYTVRYHWKDSEGNSHQIIPEVTVRNLEYGKTFAVSAETIKGYTLDGDATRDVVAGYDANSVITFYYTGNRYNVTLDYNGGHKGGQPDFTMDTFTVTFGKDDFTTIEVPVREGYSFTGWYDEDGVKAYGIDGKHVQGKYWDTNNNWQHDADVTLYAQWEINTYTVKFHGNGSTQGSMADQTFAYNEAKALTAEGFTRSYAVNFKKYNDNQSNVIATATFLGWATSADSTEVVYNDGQTVQNLVNVSATSGAVIDLYAVWQLEEITVVAAQTRTGYTFGGWKNQTDGETYWPGDKYTPTANTTFEEIWTANQYQITFNYNGGQPVGGGASTTYVMTYFDSDACKNMSILEPQKLGYNFTGWKTASGDMVYDASGKCVKNTQYWDANERWIYPDNVTLYAQWEEITYTVKFVGGEGTTGSVADIPAAFFTPVTMPENGFEKVVAVTYDVAGGTNLTPANTQVNLEAAFTKWVLEGTWDPTGKQPGVQVTHYDATQDCVITYAAEWAHKSTVLPTVEREGYNFLGWSDGTATYAAGTTVTPEQSVTYTAQWQIKTYTVTWLDWDDTVLKTETVNHDTVPSYGATPTREGNVQYSYTFKQWSPSVVAATADAVYIAEYTQSVNQYTVTFYDEDGTTILAQGDYKYGTSAADITPADPNKAPTERNSFRFAGWSPAVEDVTGTANYRATYDKMATLTGEIDRGTQNGPITVKAGEEAVITLVPSEGYIVHSTKIGDDETEILNGGASQWSFRDNDLSENIHVVVTTRPKDYDIYYELNGGRMPDGVTAPTSYNIETETFTIPNPVRDGYKFTGWWYLSSLQTPEMTATIPKGTTGDRTYAANWEIEEYTLEFDVADGVMPDNAVDSTTYKITDTVAFPQPTREHYDFQGWKVTTADGNWTADDVLTAESLTGKFGNVKLTAQWQIHTFTVTFKDDDGTVISEEIYDYGTPAEDITPSDPEKAPTAQYTYKFTGWDPRVEDVTEDAAYTATYKSTVNQYTVKGAIDVPARGTVKFSLDKVTYEEKENNQMTVDYGTVVHVSIRMNEGYRIIAATDGNGNVTNYSSPLLTGYYADNLVVKEDWSRTLTTALVNYSITLELNDGVLPEGTANPMTYTVESDDFVLPKPTRYGYEFLGWAEESDAASGEKELKISKGTTGNKTYYAVWKQAFAELTISAVTADTNQNFIFDVTDGTTSLQVVVPGGGSVTVKELPIGTYRVTEKSSWSWREADVNSQEVDISTKNTVTFDFGGTDKTQWLSGFSHFKSIFAAKQ